jgi:NADPH:quinone reductase-like Zn-dependent oxidoreductase
MKAAQIDRFGGPDVLTINEVERHVPGAGEVLVRVEASSVNGHDVMVRSGGLKMVSGRKFPLGTGLDFAGVVVAAGPGAQGCGVGDRVWGTVHPRQRHVTGAAAEYVALPADRAHAMGGHVTALARDRYAQALGDLGTDRVLVYDATPSRPETST